MAATLTISPEKPRRGQPVSVVGAGFPADSLVRISIPRIGVASEILTNADGAFGTDDVADAAEAILEVDTGENAEANNTVKLGAVTYTFKASVTTTANEVLIGADAAASLANLVHAVNLTGGAGKYGSDTVIHPTVKGVGSDALTATFRAKTPGVGGNDLDSVATGDHINFDGTDFAGGTDATGVSSLIFTPEEVGRYDIHAEDARASVQVWSN